MLPIVFGIIVAAILLVGAYLSTPAGRGWLGEFRVKLIIGKTKPGVRYIINDLVIKTEDGKTSQIDHVCINQNGIFVIETKNYSGRIYGKENQQEWTQVLNYGRTKNRFYNPIKQNRTHVYRIAQILPKGTPIDPAVVFVQGNVGFIEASGVYTLSGLKTLINTPMRGFSQEEMENFYHLLLNADDESVTRSEHVRNIAELQETVERNVCPRCGKPLVLRHGKYGDFWGCSGYPDCRFIKKN